MWYKRRPFSFSLPRLPAANRFKTVSLKDSGKNPRHEEIGRSCWIVVSDRGFFFLSVRRKRSAFSSSDVYYMDSSSLVPSIAEEELLLSKRRFFSWYDNDAPQ